jgi:hypothetical protein
MEKFPAIETMEAYRLWLGSLPPLGYETDVIPEKDPVNDFTGTTTGTCPRCGKSPCKMPPRCNY